MAKRVALIGLSFRFPSTDTARYWPDLLQGRDLVTEIDPSRWATSTYCHPLREHPGTSYSRAAGSLGDISGFDAAFFGISPREACLMDPQQRLLLELAWEAMENAGVRPSSLRGSDCGVYIGIASADYSYRVSEDLGILDTSFATGNATSIAANRISYVYDLHGPSIAMDTACSSSMVAFHYACRAIESGEISQALTGGISLHLHPFSFLGFSKASMLSRQGRCNAFDASGDGYVRSEGGGLFLLKDLDRATADGDPILAVVAGTAINTDGRKSGLTVPSAKAQAELLRGAYARAGISPDEISYLEAHGTGTPVGDPIETRAIGEALGHHRPEDRPLPIGSVKSNMGHLEAASGVAGLVKAVFSLKHRQVPPTIGIRELNPAIRAQEWNLDIVTRTQPLPASGRLVIGVNSFGFGGANAHAILCSPDDEPGAEAGTAISGEPSDFPVIVSGRSPQALLAAARDMAAHLEGLDREACYDAAYQAARRRDWHERRALVFCRLDGEDPAQQLRRFAEGEAEPAVATAERLADAKGPVFVYSGNGSQWIGMGQRLLADMDFRSAVDEVDALFEPLVGYRLADELTDGLDATRFGRTEFAQPALFALQVGITRMLARQGVEPIAVMGHSVGEVAAAWACGVLSLSDAVLVIHHRSRLQGTTLGSGQMSAVGVDGASAQVLIDELGLASELFVAGYNSSRGATIAGGAAVLSRLETALQERDVASKRLDLDYAFHSPAMDGLQAELAASLSALRPGPAHCPFYSAVDGTELTGPQLDASYWWRNIRQPVRFEQAASSAVQQGCNLFIEVGPHPVLRGYVNDALKNANRTGRVLATASLDEDDPARILTTAAQALLAGAQVRWDRLFPRPGRFHALPTYPWQRERHWHPETPESLGLLQRHHVHPLLGYPLAQHEATWENQLDTLTHSALADHVVGGAVVFPGAGFAELALAAALQRHPAPHAELENLEIPAPLLLGETPSKLLRTSIEPDDGRVRIRARELGSADAWTLHASARLLSEPSDSRLRSPLPALPDRAPDFLAADHKALMCALGLNYGPAYQLIEEGWRVDSRTVLSSLRRDDGSQAFHLAPARLDSAFQLTAHLLMDDAAASLGLAFVPVRIGRLSLRADAPAPRYVQLRLRRRSTHALTIDISLYDDDGKAIAALSEVSLRSVRLLKAEGDRLGFVEEALTPRPRDSAISGVPLPGLEQALSAALEQAATDPIYARYAEEAEPLMDALCERYGIDALRALADSQGRLEDTTLVRYRTRTPSLSPYLDMLLRRAESSGLAVRAEAGWSLPPEPADEPAAADIWNTLTCDYPEHFGPALAAGRIGLNLTAMLRGLHRAEDAAASQFTHLDLVPHLLAEPARRHLAQALSGILSTAQDDLPPGRRLRVLEIGAHTPWLGADCCAVLDFRHADYSYAAADENGREAAAMKLAAYPDALVQLIGNPEDDTGATDTAVDLAIVHCDFDSLADTRAALHHARARLAPGAALILIAHHPARWADFVFGARPEWWIDAVDGSKLSMQQTPSSWRQELQALGCACDPALELAPGAMAGAYVLHARAGELPETAPADPQPPTEAERWLLLADTSGPEAELASKLTRALRDKGCEATLLSLEADASADTLPVQASLAAYEHVVHAVGLYAGDGDASARRCALTAAVLRACEHHDQPAALWLLTAGVHPPDGTPPGGVSSLSGAALSGYGRSLMNETSAVMVRLLDLPAAAAAAPLEAIMNELRHPDAEQEIVLAADGARYAPRLRAAPRPRPAGARTPGPHVRKLGFELPGQLRNLRWESHNRQAPADDEVEVRVHATGLNFRDVMYALGLLADEALENGYAGPTLGLEFAGTVERCGAAVVGYAPGDKVMGFGPASFGDHVTTVTTAVAAMPEGISFEAAATIPGAFFTVYYALHHLARLAPGEKVLIHGAAGGVGIAAIQYAQWRGAEIHATAGTEEKRDFLRLMGVSRVYDSRTLSYAEKILVQTGGRGVDVVLNSLAGEAVRRNLDVLAPFGRFLELGKRDFYENTRIGLRPFRNNISYFGIDADQLLASRPELARALYGEMMTLFSEGLMRPLPQRVFEARDIVDAFRYMQQSRQIGKIVVTYRRGLPEIEPDDPKPVLALAPDGSYLVTGGLSGFGLRAARWLAAKGARHLVLIGRSGPASEEARQAVASLRERGISVIAQACDVTDAHALNALLSQVRAELPPLRGVIHAAAVIEDGLAQGADEAQITRVLAPKLQGAVLLHELTRNDPLDCFVLFSSATTLFGTPGQSAYVAANSGLEALARLRRSQGLPATCPRWGAIDDAGYLARNEQIKQALQHRMGGSATPAEQALAVLEDMLLSGTDDLATLELDWHVLARHLPASATPRYADLARLAGDARDEGDSSEDLLAQLAELDDAALAPRIIELLKQEVSEILRVPADRIDPGLSLYDIGLDSLMGVELVVALEGRFGIRLPVMTLNESPTLDKLSARLILALRGDTRHDTGDDDGITTHIKHLASQHAQEAAPEDIAAITRRVRANQTETEQGLPQ